MLVEFVMFNSFSKLQMPWRLMIFSSLTCHVTWMNSQHVVMTCERLKFITGVHNLRTIALEQANPCSMISYLSIWQQCVKTKSRTAIVELSSDILDYA